MDSEQKLIVMTSVFADASSYLFIKGMNAYESGNYEKAVKLSKQACDGGSADGCFLPGALYLKGQGVRQSYHKAKELFGKGLAI